MRYYKLFRKYQGGVGWIEQDPVTLNVESKTSGDVIVETLTPTKVTTYYANGHYYVALTPSKYTLDTDYKLIWTFEMVSGQTQTIIEYFRLSEIGGIISLVLIPIGGKLIKALQKFGDTLLIIENGDQTAILGKSWANKRVSNYWSRQYVRNVMFAGTPEVFGGNIIKDVKRDHYYFIYNLHKVTVKEDALEQNGTILNINEICAIHRLSGTGGAFGGAKQTFTLEKDDIRAHFTEISGELRKERPALSDEANYLLYLQSTESLLPLDRIIIDSENYQVGHINKNLEGLIEAEISNDLR